MLSRTQTAVDRATSAPETALNQSAQTRTFAYILLSRITSDAPAETAAVELTFFFSRLELELEPTFLTVGLAKSRRL